MKSFESFEKDIVIKSGDVRLAAKMSLASPEAPMLVLVHGFAGNKDENGLFQDASAFFHEHGFSVLRFDFRGCGESSGFSFRHVRIKDLQLDLKNVFRFIQTQSSLRPSAIGLVGFSLGAAIAILSNPRNARAHVYWSPAIFTANDMYPRYQTREVLQEIREKGFFVKAGLEVSPEFISDLRENEIEYHIRSIKARVLLIHGGQDRRIPVSSSAQATKLIRHSRFCLVPEADHSFRQGPKSREYLLSASLTWFERYLPKSRTSGTVPLSPCSMHLFDGPTAVSI